MLGVVIPARNEEKLIARCLRSIRAASNHPLLLREEVRVVVVLDACTDRTGDIVLAEGAEVVAIDARNVGIARAVGAQVCLDRGCRWLAFTDADSEVDDGWLVHQLALGCDAVCGTISVSDWGDHGSALQEHFARTYTDADGHRHIHGANLGVSAAACRSVVGFEPIALSKDVALVRALVARGAQIAWSTRPRVVTSARRDSGRRRFRRDFDRRFRRWIHFIAAKSSTARGITGLGANQVIGSVRNQGSSAQDLERMLARDDQVVATIVRQFDQMHIPLPCEIADVFHATGVSAPTANLADSL